MAYSLQILFKKRKRFLTRLQTIADNINALIQIKLNVRTVKEEFNQYDDLLKLFVDTGYQYHSKLEDTSSIIISRIMKETVQENIRRAQKVRSISIK